LQWLGNERKTMKTSRRWAVRGFLCALAVPLFAACSMTTVIPPVTPTPNTALVASQKSLELAFAPAVAERLALQYAQREAGNPPDPVDIQSWHTTLETGFRNGFQSAFPAKQGPSADLTLRIDKADLEVGDFDHARARITYAATLTGADGTVRRTAGTASRGAARGQIVEFDKGIANDVSMSVAAMYEDIAKELFVTPAAAPRAAGCVPGQSIACVGPQGCQGFQVCGSDGAHFEACSCGK
jgi:hypothetical protein